MLSSKSSLKTLSSIARILQKSKPAENPLGHIVSLVRDSMKVDVCSLYWLQAETLILVATDGLRLDSIGKVRMRINEGLTGLAVEQLSPVIVNQASLHPRFKFFPETGEEQFHSFAAAPLLHHDQAVGVLTIQSEDPRHFNSQEIEVLRIIAFQLAGVIDNLMTLESLKVGKGKASSGKSIHLQGTAISPGFGMGRAIWLHSQEEELWIALRKTRHSSPKAEWKKLETSLQKASADLLRLEKKLLREFSQNESDIFYAHRMILSDLSFLNKLKMKIEKGQKSSEAVVEVFGEYLTQFEKIADPHLKERAADFKDLKQRVLKNLLGRTIKKKSQPLKGILVAETLTPSDALKLDSEKILGIVTRQGGATSHAAILARSLGIPAIMGVNDLQEFVHTGDWVIVDGNTGELFINPEKTILETYEKSHESYAGQLVQLQKLTHQLAVTQDGQSISLKANVGLVSDLKKLRYFGAEGVGLYRTEIPFLTQSRLPTETEQIAHYRKVFEEAQGLPITFRILDAGGDKPLKALPIIKESNPFLGYRSIRLSLANPELIQTQLRALLKSSQFGSMRILIPMISGLEELRMIKAIFNELRQELEREGHVIAKEIPLGIMIEVPSAVTLASHLIQEVDFVSIGTNDLIQYLLAVDRNNVKVAPFFEPLHPAVLKALYDVAQQGKIYQKPVGICGEIAGDPKLVPLLIGLGVHELSMAPAAIPKVKEVILNSHYSQLEQMAQKALQAGTIEEVKQVMTLC